MCQDITLWWERLAPGGLLLGDDYTGFWPGVVRAVCEFAADRDLQLYASVGSPAPKWWIFKPQDRPRGFKPTPRNATWRRQCRRLQPDQIRPHFVS